MVGILAAVGLFGWLVWHAPTVAAPRGRRDTAAAAAAAAVISENFAATELEGTIHLGDAEEAVVPSFEGKRKAALSDNAGRSALMKSNPFFRDLLRPPTKTNLGFNSLSRAFWIDKCVGGGKRGAVGSVLCIYPLRVAQEHARQP